MSYENARAYSKQILNDLIAKAKAAGTAGTPVQETKQVEGLNLETIETLIAASVHPEPVKEMFRKLFAIALPKVQLAPKTDLPEGTVAVDCGFKPGMVVVVLDDDCGLTHNGSYLVTFVDNDGDATGVGADGEDDSAYLPREVEATRLATPEEIDQFYTSLNLAEKKFLVFAA